MKKLTALLMLVCITLMPFASLAETITWEEVGMPFAAQSELEGDFVALNEMGLAIWIPSDLVYVEPSAEDAAAGRYAIFIDNDQECALVIDAVYVEGMTLDQAYENAVASGMKEPEIVNVNGLDTLSYINEALNCASLVLVDTNCNMIIFTLSPIDNDIAKIAFTVISSSLMPLE